MITTHLHDLRTGQRSTTGLPCAPHVGWCIIVSTDEETAVFRVNEVRLTAGVNRMDVYGAWEDHG